MSDRHNDATLPFTQGGIATAEDGVVMLDGPDGIAISMTPDAAEQTGSSLMNAAREARGQNASRA